MNLNVDDLHKNRELPSAYVCFLGVLDSTLPMRGTAHRVVRGGAPEPENTINTFLGLFSTTPRHRNIYKFCFFGEPSDWDGYKTFGDQATKVG